MKNPPTKKEQLFAAASYLTGIGPLLHFFMIEETPFVSQHIAKAKQLDKKWLPFFFLLLAVCAVLLFLEVQEELFKGACALLAVYTIIYVGRSIVAAKDVFYNK